MKDKAGLLPFAVGGLAFACFLCVMGVMAMAVPPLWGRTLVLLLPTLVFFAIGAAARKGSMNPHTAAAVTAVLAVVLFLLSVLYTILLLIWTATADTTDIRYYRRAYARIDGKEAVSAYFPASVPEEARDVEFYYRPRFLQGGEVFRLSYAAAEDEIIRQSMLLRAAAEWSGPDAEWFRIHNQGSRGSDCLRFQLFGSGFSNHGEESYVLIDQAGGRIEFYYSSW